MNYPSKEEIQQEMELHNSDEVGIDNPWTFEDAEYHLLLSDKYHKDDSEFSYNGRTTSIDNIKAAIKAQKWDKYSYVYALNAMEPHRAWDVYTKKHLVEIFYEYIQHSFRSIARFSTFALLEWTVIEEFPHIKGDDLLVETNFYKWLVARKDDGFIDARFIDAIKTYTKHIDKPFMNRNDGEAHKFTFQCFWAKVNDPKRKLS